MSQSPYPSFFAEKGKRHWMQSLVEEGLDRERICKGEWQEPEWAVNGNVDGAVKSGWGGQDNTPFPGNGKGQAEGWGTLRHDDEMTSILCACLSLHLHGWVNGAVPS